MAVNLTRPVAPDPYSLLPSAPAFTLTSEDFGPGERLPDVHTNISTDTGAAGNVSPQLSWEGFPDATQSFLISCFDPDAPGPAGWWHWTVVDVPATTTSLAAGADLPAGAFALRGDDGEARYVGAAPPPGDQLHRYFFVVHALDVPSLGFGPDMMPGAANTAVLFHTLARAVLVGTYQR